MKGVLEGMYGIAPIDIAERWFARLMAPDCSLKEKEQFEAWLRLAPENAVAFEETKALWADLGGLDEDEFVGPNAKIAPQADAEPFMEQWTEAVRIEGSRKQSAQKRSWLPAGAGIAALLIAAVLSWQAVERAAPAVPYVALTSIRDVTLPDGSTVRLDLETSISTRLSHKQRVIELVKGRAVFEVAHDAARPFVVDAGVGLITALGTQFQVQRSGEDVSVTLLEGSVAIDSATSPSDRRSLRLVPGQRASYTPSTKSWAVASVDSAALISWSHGFHVFSAVPLDEAITEINRYSVVKLRLSDPALATMRLSGSFKLGAGKAVASALPYAIPVKVEEKGSEIVVSKK